jgi:hypothetical protein
VSIVPALFPRRVACAAILFLSAGLAVAGARAPEGAGPLRFDPYENESEVLALGPDLTIENRLDRVTIIGSVDLTLDQGGAEKAEALRALLDRVCDAQRARKPLPEHVVTAPAETVDNPFDQPAATP